MASGGDGGRGLHIHPAVVYEPTLVLSGFAGKVPWVLQASEIIAFGDDMNDAEMLTEFGYGIAVENAIPEVKDMVSYICESNDNDGVAKYIEKLIIT